MSTDQPSLRSLSSFLRSTPNRSRLRSWLTWLFLTVPFLLPWQARGEVTFEWDPNPEPEVAGYKLYFGTTSGVYTTVLDAGAGTVITVNDLISTVTYYFAITAYDAEGVESEPSDELVYAIPAPEAIAATGILPNDLPPGVQAPLPEGSISIFMAGAAPPAGGHPEVIVAGASTMAVSLDFSEDLIEWQTLGTLLNPTGALRFTNSRDDYTPRGFFRAREIPLPSVPAPE